MRLWRVATTSLAVGVALVALAAVTVDHPDAEGDASGSQRAAGSAGPAGSTGSEAPAAPEKGGSEVPADAVTPETVDQVLPEPGAAPSEAVPVLRGSAVSSSDVSTSAGIRQVSLVAQVPGSPGTVLAAYRAILSDQGFRERPVPAVGGAMAAGFRRGKDSLVVTATSKGKGTARYTVFGDLHDATKR